MLNNILIRWFWVDVTLQTHQEYNIISNKCSDFLPTSGEPSVNRIDLQALTLSEPLWHKQVPDPLAVQLSENRLCMMTEIQTIEGGWKDVSSLKANT